ncbi:unnamed protein product [Echinostoma caproni]|uniref:Ion_trans domain-containing protein n=1 Tax=Echinostoma caproni TaxID=27848 RepID=A0A3P8HGI5_9TREM|nr:unnamed protein product [Echinostoma caproni]
MLEHKLVEMLIKRKWLRSGLVYYLNLLIYLVFLAFFSAYMLLAKSADLVHQQNTSYANMSLSEACTGGKLISTAQSVLHAIAFSKYVVLSFGILNLAKELFQLAFMGDRYFSVENCIEFAIFLLAISTVVDANTCLIKYGLKVAWQWQCGALGVFLAWLNLLLFLRRVPTLGMFVLMFTVIVRTFAKFFSVFFLFIFAFAFGFHILLSNQVSFNSLGNSLIKTSVMTLGEFEFDAVAVSGSIRTSSAPWCNPYMVIQMNRQKERT